MPSLPRLKVDATLGPQLQVRYWEFLSRRQFLAPAAAHAALELSWVDSGAVCYGVARRRIELGPGAALLVPEQLEHTTRFLGPVCGGSLKIGPGLLTELFASSGRRERGQPRDPLILAGAQPLIALGRLISAEAQGDGLGRHLLVDCLLQALAVHLRRRLTERQPGPELDPRLGAALDRLHRDYHQALTVAELAKAAGMSRYHFGRQFHQETGKSPYRYLLELRLSRAAALLRQEGHNVTSAALAVGYNDLSHFSRAFRSWAGSSPEAYRRQQRAERRRPGPT